jgi:hypothetical protein
MNYSQQMLARAEYERMVKSVPSVPEYAINGGVEGRSMNWVRAIFLSVLHLVVR